MGFIIDYLSLLLLLLLVITVDVYCRYMCKQTKKPLYTS